MAINFFKIGFTHHASCVRGALQIKGDSFSDRGYMAVIRVTRISHKQIVTFANGFTHAWVQVWLQKKRGMQYLLLLRGLIWLVGAIYFGALCLVLDEAVGFCVDDFIQQLFLGFAFTVDHNVGIL